jgi:hypothetical protein
VDQHPVGGLSLAGMTRDRISSDRGLAGLFVCLPEIFSFDVRLVGQLGQQKQVSPAETVGLLPSGSSRLQRQPYSSSSPSPAAE